MVKKCVSCDETVQNNDNVACLTCFQRPSIVVNILLMFVNSYRSRSAGFQLKTAVLKFYSPEEIEEARQSLIDGVKDLIPSYPHLYKKRVDSSKRSAKDVMVEDIIEMFKALDHIEENLIPKFLGDNAMKVPGCPEAANNMMSLYDNLAIQQRELEKLQETMTRVIQDVAKNSSELVKIKNADIAQQTMQTPSSTRKSLIVNDRQNNGNTEASQAHCAQPETCHGG